MLNETGQVPVSDNSAAHMSLNGRGRARAASVHVLDARWHDAQIAFLPNDEPYLVRESFARAFHVLEGGKHACHVGVDLGHLFFGLSGVSLESCYLWRYSRRGRRGRSDGRFGNGNL